MKALFLLIGVMLTSHSQAATVNTSLYILRDSIAFDTGEKLPYATFNATNSFEEPNSRIVVNVGDQLILNVVNFDSETRAFAIKGETSTVSIPAGDSVEVTYDCLNSGVFIFYDPTNFPDIASTGLAGMLVVKDHNHSSFYWNIKEHQSNWNDTIYAGGNVDWTSYYPDYFTINGKSNPHINNDADARIIGSVGDTLRINLANTGQSIHSMHFHGYHVKIVSSSRDPQHAGRLKDSLPIYPFETLVLELVPDKEGEYPVHDHNLIGTTGGGVYPMGMFTTMLIAP